MRSHLLENGIVGICDRICWRVGNLGYALAKLSAGIALCGELGIWGMRNLRDVSRSRLIEDFGYAKLARRSLCDASRKSFAFD
ncbi:MAG: hypothetical protein HC903_25210 [Methylacidiphilales bacterium]|nr:hypothetical protein [Candidatus Methylacidiphilales bacterium]